jgi:hypothetical protein
MFYLALSVICLNRESVRTKKMTLIRSWLSSLANMFQLALTVIFPVYFVFSFYEFLQYLFFCFICNMVSFLVYVSSFFRVSNYQ